MFKSEYLGRIEYDFQKSRVTGPWDHKVSVSAKKFEKKFHACVPLNITLLLINNGGVTTPNYGIYTRISPA
jgi:hypothetical protein